VKIRFAINPCETSLTNFLRNGFVRQFKVKARKQIPAYKEKEETNGKKLHNTEY
jgi:hypothetical protein